MRGPPFVRPNSETHAIDRSGTWASTWHPTKKVQGKRPRSAWLSHMGISEDGRHWDELNSGRPILISDVGEKGVRDSFLLRSHDGRKVWLIATDLSVYRHPDWHRNTHAGSRSIIVWESSDLVHWTSPRLVTVAPGDAGCAWAPEAIYDRDSGDYLVYWASTTGRDNFSKQRIWAAHTRDFQSFGRPFVFAEEPNDIIDINITDDGKTYYRFLKDDQQKSVTMAVSSHLIGPWREVPQFTAGQGKNFEGPILFRLGPAVDAHPREWALLLDNVSDRIGAGASGYMAFVSTNPRSGLFTRARDFHFPYPFRHGSVLPITKAEVERLKSTYSGH